LNDPTPALDRDTRLANLLESLEQSRRDGQPVDIAQVAAAHPDLADELRQLWAMVQFTQTFARPIGPRDSLATADATPPMDSGTFPRVFGDYELLEELGRGGMGVVFRARQKSLQRVVALKMLLHGDAASPDDRARIRAEARAVALLKHPNIVPVFEVGEHEGRDYFTMPLVEGVPLTRLIADGPLPSADAARIVSAVARAVHHAHQLGIVHRDLKPANVLMAEHEIRGSDTGKAAPNPSPTASIPLVTDFGLAKWMGATDTDGRLTQTGAVVGTPSYMPPEQASANRGAVGPLSDVYSLGAILYTILTGRPPFQAATRLETVFLVLQEDPVPPRLLNPRIDRDLEVICLKCLEKDPARRYVSAAALADDLDAFLSGESLSIRPSEFRDFFGWLFRPTHHVAILEKWGLLWIAHSAFTLLLCTLTYLLVRNEVSDRLPYLSLWGAGVMVWSAIFWRLRRRGGPVTFVERQIAHMWAAGVLGSFGVLLVEMMLDRPVLEFAPILAVIGAMVFLAKAGTLSGLFYLAVAAQFVTGFCMTRYPQSGMLLYGITLSASYFVPGIIFYRRKRAGNHARGIQT
jgi:serine/threonine-protein kinase